MKKEEKKDTYNQDVDAETFGHALPDQLVSDLTFLQQPLHPRAFLCTLWEQVRFQSRAGVIGWI